VIKSGEIEILDESGEAPKIVRVHRPTEFTGDVAHLTGGPVGRQRTRADCKVYEVTEWPHVQVRVRPASEVLG